MIPALWYYLSSRFLKPMGKSSLEDSDVPNEMRDLVKLLKPNAGVKRYGTAFEYIQKTAQELGQKQVFYTLDFADVLWKVQQWMERLPNIHIYYAVKVNSDPVLLKLLTQLGLAFDCASEGEIRMVLEAGAAPRNIIFAHTIKTFSGLKYAASVGVDLMTFDNEEELLKIKKFHPHARLLLRICPSNVHCLWDLSEKFGCELSDGISLLERAQEIGLNVVGVSFHVGALCTDPESFVSTIADCRKIFAVAKNLGFHFEILDIGGGFFGARGTEDSFRKLSEAIRSALREHFPGPEVQFIAEPGCYIVASAFTLVTTVFGKRKQTKEDEKGSEESKVQVDYYINDSIYGSFFRGIQNYDVKPEPLLIASELSKRPVFKSRIFGQTCCSEDTILKSVDHPELFIGECLLWRNAGAYSRAVCSEFCGVPLPAHRRIFHAGHSRLNTGWIPNAEDVTNLLKENCVIIESED